MRSITFGQALLAVGLVGLTFVLVVAWEVTAGIAVGEAAGGGPSIVAPVLALALTVAIALGAMVVGIRGLGAGDGAPPLTRSQLLVAAGLLGLLVVTASSSQTFLMLATAEWLGGWITPDEAAIQHRYGELARNLSQVLPLRAVRVSGFGPPPSYDGALAVQIISLVVPLLVLAIGFAIGWKEARLGDQTARAPGRGTVAVASALFALFIGCGAGPYLTFDVALKDSYYNSYRFGEYIAEYSTLVAGYAVPVAALVLLLVWRRGRKIPRDAAWIPVLAALLGLAACASAGAHSGALLMVGLGVPLACLLCGALARAADPRPAPATVTTRHLLIAAVLANFMILGVFTPPAINTLSLWTEQNPAYGLLLAILTVAFVIQGVVLAVAARRTSSADEEASERS